MLFAKFTYNEYIRPYFLLHVVSTIFASDLPVLHLGLPPIIFLTVFSKNFGVDWSSTLHSSSVQILPFWHSQLPPLMNISLSHGVNASNSTPLTLTLSHTLYGQPTPRFY